MAHPIDPIYDDAFDAAMAALGPFEPSPTLALALSGGGDSLALCLLLERWLRRRGGHIRALTVDHGLRADSLSEARQVAAWMAARGIDHEILTWRGAKPGSRVQEKARAARYGLLTRWCRRHGVLHLLLAHHGDDQAETVAMRAARRSGGEGLSGMAPLMHRDGVRLLRPLLGFRHAQLLDLLRRAGQPWLEDPSNQDLRFERVRMRHALDDGGALRADSQLSLAQKRAGDSDVVRAQGAVLLASRAALYPAGFAMIDADLFRAAGNGVAIYCLKRLLQCIGGKAYAPGDVALARALDRLHTARPGHGPTLGGCRLVKGREKVLICRENRDLPAPVRLSWGGTVQWDRFRAGCHGRRPAFFDKPLYLKGLGLDGWRHLRHRLGPEAVAILPAPIRAVTPAVWHRETVLMVPGLPPLSEKGLAFPPIYVEFAPAYPLLRERRRRLPFEMVA